MAAALGDLIRLTDFQTYLGETVLNVYYYRITEITGVTGDYLEIIHEEWYSKVLAAVLPIQGPTLIHTNREVRNLSNNLDYFMDSFSTPGEFDGDNALNSFTSLGFMLVRESLATRNGYKRYAGLSENQVQGNTYNGSLALTDDIAAALAMDLMLGLTILAEPVIVKRPIIPPVEDYVYSSIGSAQFRGLGTQNTRKPGRGI
jgi:hypothetical protein